MAAHAGWWETAIAGCEALVGGCVVLVDVVDGADGVVTDGADGVTTDGADGVVTDGADGVTTDGVATDEAVPEVGETPEVVVEPPVVEVELADGAVELVVEPPVVEVELAFGAVELVVGAAGLG